MTDDVTDAGNEGALEVYTSGSPSKIEKRDNLRLAYECIQHKSRAYKNPAEKWAYASKVEDLMFRLLRFTKSELREKLQNHYHEMMEKIKEINKTTLDLDKKEREEIEIRFQYAHMVHQHNIKLLPQSAIIMQDVEGDLDVTNEEILKVIRGGDRSDDKGLSISR